MVAALIKLVQGALAPPAGESLLGVQATPVTISNNDDTGVVRWTYELLDVPNNSALSPGILSDGAVPTAILTPDPADQEVWGCYRIKLTVYDAGGGQATDIRNFAVGTPNNQWIVPSFLAEASEMNFGGTDRGWKKWVNEILEKVDLIDARWSMPPDSSTRFLSVGRGIRNGSFVERYGYYSTYFGHNVGLGATGIPPSGESNAGFGHNSLLRLSSGTRNCTHGILAGAAISSAEHCVMFGYYTAAGGLTGSPVWYVTGDFNAAFGSYGLLNLRAGEGNATFGTRPGENVRDGDRNIGYGWMPIYYVQDGNDNIGIGTLAGPTADVDGSISIGAYATAYAAWTCQFGGTGAYAIDVGFGLSSAPTARVHLPAGTATKAPLRFSIGVLKTVPGDGEIEYDGTHFYADISGARYQLDQQTGGGGTPQREDDSVGQRTVRNPIRTILDETDCAYVASQAPTPGSLIAYRVTTAGGKLESGFFFLTFSSGTIHVRSSSIGGSNQVDSTTFSSTLNRGKSIQVITTDGGESDAVAVFTEAHMRVYTPTSTANTFTQRFAISLALTGDPTICGNWLFVANTTDAKIYATPAIVDSSSTFSSVLTLADLTESIVGDTCGNLFVVSTTAGTSTIRRYSVNDTTGALTLAATCSFGANGECTTNLAVDGRYVFCGAIESGTYRLVRYDVALNTVSAAVSSVDLPSRSYVTSTAEYVWVSGQDALGYWNPETLVELGTRSHAGESGSLTKGITSDPDSRTTSILWSDGVNAATIDFAVVHPPLRLSSLAFTKSSLRPSGATKLLGLDSKNEVVTAAAGVGGAYGAFSSRPAAGTAGRIFVCTDSPVGQWVDTGTIWRPLVGSVIPGTQPPAAAGFTGHNVVGCSLADNNGTLKLYAPSDGVGNFYNHSYTLTTAGGAFWVEGSLEINVSRAYVSGAATPCAGILVRDSDGVTYGLYRVVDRANGNSCIASGQFTNDTTGSLIALAQRIPVDQTHPIFFRIVCNATDLYAYYSLDGKDWLLWETVVIGDTFDYFPDQYGIAASPEGNNVTAYVLHFTGGDGSP